MDDYISHFTASGIRCYEIKGNKADDRGLEHWYPQHPSEGTFEAWNDGVDQFGNLCIIQRNVNSKFSNMSPEAKKSTFREMIGKGSLKLRIMCELTEKKGNMTASACWKDEVCQTHEDEMIDILWKACYGEE